MPTTSPEIQNRPFVHHTSRDVRSVHTDKEAFATAQRGFLVRDETEFCLQESQRIVEVLRRAVADRDLDDSTL